MSYPFINCPDCLKQVPERKYCDKCGAVLRRSYAQWNELLLHIPLFVDVGRKSYDLIWDTAPAKIRSVLFEKFYKAGQYERIVFTLSNLPGGPKEEHDLLWYFRVQLTQGDKGAAFTGLAALLGKTAVKEEAGRDMLALMLPGGFDDKFGELPRDFRQKFIGELEKTRQTAEITNRLENLLEVIPPNARTAAEWELYLKYAWLRRRPAGFFLSLPAGKVFDQTFTPVLKALIANETDSEYLLRLYAVFNPNLRAVAREKAITLHQSAGLLGTLASLETKTGEEWRIILELAKEAGRLPEYADIAPAEIIRGNLPLMFEAKLYRQVMTALLASEKWTIGDHRA